VARAYSILTTFTDRPVSVHSPVKDVHPSI